MLEAKGFNEWAENYDASVLNKKHYPFLGYSDLMNEIIEEIGVLKDVSILDVGIGTGLLSSYLSQNGAIITGVDFSSKMIEIASSRIKDGLFYTYDIKKGLPKELEGKKYPFIISTYVIHHFDLNQKVELIKAFKNHLTENGKILIGDVAFKTKADLESCKTDCGRYWDNEEIYLVFEELKEKLEKENIQITYQQISSCAGLCIIS